MAAMGPQLRMMFNNPQFQEMISNPESLRQMFQMAGQMHAAGVDPSNASSLFGGMPPMPFGLLGPGAFGAGTGAAAGNPTSGTGSAGTTSPTGAQPQNLFAQAAAGGGASPAAGTGATPALNPLAALMGAGAPGASGAGATAAGGAAGSPASPNAAANPFGMVDPNLLQQMFGGFGGGGWPGSRAAPAAAPADSRPPEERFQVQLQVGLFIGTYCSLETDKRCCASSALGGTAIARYGFFKCVAKC